MQVVFLCNNVYMKRQNVLLSAVESHIERSRNEALPFAGLPDSARSDNQYKL